MNENHNTSINIKHIIQCWIPLNRNDIISLIQLLHEIVKSAKKNIHFDITF